MNTKLFHFALGIFLHRLLVRAGENRACGLAWLDRHGNRQESQPVFPPADPPREARIRSLVLSENTPDYSV